MLRRSTAVKPKVYRIYHELEHYFPFELQIINNKYIIFQHMIV